MKTFILILDVNVTLDQTLLIALCETKMKDNKNKTAKKELKLKLQI